jgi:aspartyl-tRNA(Asn)/glutamyl-tRNA(Gln) amidotransferase subunit C
MGTDVKTIKKIADLAALSINDEEAEGFARDLNLIIKYMDQLSNLDTGDIKPMEHVLALDNVLREDIPTNENRKDILMKSAPETIEGCYIVPSVVESL